MSAIYRDSAFCGEAAAAAADLAGRDLSGANLAGKNLSGADLTRCNLRGADLSGAQLDGADLLAADLTEARLDHCSARRANFGGTRCGHASFFQADLGGATLSNASLEHADFRAACLGHARLRDASLVHANFARADLREADLEASDLDHAHFDGANLRGAHLENVRGYRHASWIGADIRDVDFCGAYMVRRHIRDENYLAEFRRASRAHGLLYWLWRVTSDCGRSIARWALWTVALALLFGVIFQQSAIDYGPHPSALSPYYFSFVTLTTLGYGDVVPASSTAQVLVVIEVFCGYLALGGLLSIFANKMARRAD